MEPGYVRVVTEEKLDEHLLKVHGVFADARDVRDVIGIHDTLHEQIDAVDDIASYDHRHKE
jgi:hypothetical protein